MRNRAGIRFGWLRAIRVSASLGHRPVDKLRLLLFNLRIVASRVSQVQMPPPVTARLAPDGHEVLISDPGELSVLHDVMVDGEYRPRGKPEVIFDLGANVGFVTLFFRRLYPEARIVAVEADPSTYKRLVRNVEGLPGVTTLNLAMAGSNGPVSMFRTASSIGTSLASRPGPAGEPFEVMGKTLATLMDEARVDRIGLLKVDIEGAEFDMLAGAPLERVDELIAEVHYDLGTGDENMLRSVLTGWEIQFEDLPYPDRCLLHASQRQ